MSKICEQHLLDEIRFDIEAKDLLKAKLVLASLEHVSRNTQKRALYEVSQASDDFSIPLLAGVLANSPNVSKSFPQLRETMFSKVLDSPNVLLDLFSKTKDPIEMAFLAEVAGEIRLDKATPLLIDVLDKGDDIKIIGSTLISLGMIGDPSSVEAVGKKLYSDNDEIVILAMHILGELATPDAIQKLSEKLGQNPELDRMIIHTIANVQIPEALEKLNELLSSKYAHVRAAAKQKLGEIGTMSIRFLINNLKRNDTDLIIHSLNVLGDIGDTAAIAGIRNLLFNEPKDANIRFAAYEALGRLPLDRGSFALAAGLEDPVDNVRSAAAKAIDQNYNPVLAGGVRNLIRSGNAQSLSIVGTIINSQCGNIFMDLLEEDFFKEPAIQYLTDKAHPETRAFYSRILKNTAFKDLVEHIAPDRLPEKKVKLKIFAVDDSKMVLNIYRTALHNLGYESMLFEYPAVAIERVEKAKPDVILTDLNMPNITGIDLTRGVRKMYTKDELPIIMVTTQNEGQDDDAAYSAGVNGIIRKPFTETIIDEALKRLVVNLS
ncbi:MAG: response regulator [Deltaproteobacteria bacterium]|nr:response regulator [Deltaproteobacteria bacterium]